MRRTSVETTVPTVTVVWVYMLIPTALLFIAALITSLLISHFDSLLLDECNSRVRAFLFGCLLLFYVWGLFHFYVLYGFQWKNMILKLSIFGLFVIVFILWIVNGHFTLQIQISEDCFNTAYHRMIIVDLACMYIWVVYLCFTVALGMSGACQTPGDPDYARDALEKHARKPLLTPGAGVQGLTRRVGGRVQQIQTGPGGAALSTNNNHPDSAPASPLPLVEILPSESPKVTGVAGEADALFERKQSELTAQRQRDHQLELEQMELSVMRGPMRSPNEPSPPSPSALDANKTVKVHLDREDELETPARPARPGDDMPITPRLH